MERLAEAISKAAHDGKHMVMSCDELRAAASAWASYALINHDGDLLRKALGISEAIANFCNEMERDDAPN